jgi:hypothetical protein
MQPSRLKFGLHYCNVGQYIYPSDAFELVQAGEQAGFESAWPAAPYAVAGN